jgi:hypothetical protein
MTLVIPGWTSSSARRSGTSLFPTAFPDKSRLKQAFKIGQDLRIELRRKGDRNQVADNRRDQTARVIGNDRDGITFELKHKDLRIVGRDANRPKGVPADLLKAGEAADKRPRLVDAEM